MLKRRFCPLWQGSYWCRTRRQFVTRDSSAQTLTTRVRAADVPAFAAAERDGSGSGRYVVYSNAQQAVWVLAAQESVSVRLSRGESDLMTVVQLAEVKGLSIAPIGTTPFSPPLEDFVTWALYMVM